LLTQLGHEVAQAHDGRQALALLGRQPVDVVLTDVLMPEADGLEVVRAVRRDHPGVAVIVMSGGSARLPGADALQLARTLGAHAILPKPFNASDLREAIAGVLPH
jgi:CheY-like chemotaxis protein